MSFRSQGALDATQPIFLFVVGFGLATDYGVFLLSRIKEARDAGAVESEAVALGLERTGRIVTAAALLFAVAIGAFATSQIVFIKELGLGAALGVLIDASIIRALLVPSLMELLGAWNWWAPRPLRRLHERIGSARGLASRDGARLARARGRYGGLDADRHLERQLGQAARAAAAALARSSARPDVVCLQETKLADERLRRAAAATSSTGRGYEAALHGEPAWNGVAILSRVGLDEVTVGIPGAPGFPHPEARAVSATCGGDPGVLGVRAQRPGARLRALPLQARLAGRAARHGRRGPAATPSCAAT